jgi:hypothetical protein
MKASVVVVLLCLGVVLAQRPPIQATLYPFTADGFDTVILDDMSFVNEIHVQEWEWPYNLTFFIYGQSSVRTVFPSMHTFTVGATPNENWHLPFVDFHTFRNGTDIWGFGPVNPFFGRPFGALGYGGYELQVAVVSTATIRNNPRGRFFLERPLGMEGMFFSVHAYAFSPNNVIGYFAGFFPNASNTAQLHFGLVRAHFNVSYFSNLVNITDTTPGWTFNPTVDVAVIFHTTQFITYNTDFKPLIFHAWNITTDSPNTTHIVVVDPATNAVTLTTGNIDPTVPLAVTGYSWAAYGFPYVYISSAAIYQGTLFVGVGVPGIGTGYIQVLHVANLTQRAPPIMLPTNYSDPKALVVDDREGILYVGMNGGASVLRFDARTYHLTGFQALPFYLHRTWSGIASPGHIYFVTNEQHSKVYRVAKTDFCSANCMEFGYCQAGVCVCNREFELQDGRCRWPEIVHDREVIKKERDGEIALGFFFAISFVGAAVGWYFVWKNRRSAYTAVA